MSKDLTSLSLDELIRNLKVHEMIPKKDSEIVKAKVNRKPLALMAKKEYSDEECSTSNNEDEEYAMAVRDFKKFFKRDKNQRGFVGGSWSDSGEEDDEKVKDKTCLVAHASNEAYNGGNVIFGGNLRGNIIGKGTISNDSLKIDNAEHVDNLGFNLLSIEKICDNKCRVTFSEHDSEITKDGKVIVHPSYGGNRYTLFIVDDYSRKVKEPLNMTFDETPPPFKTSPLVDDDLDEDEATKIFEKKNLENDIVDETLKIDEIVNIKESRNHPLENFIGNLNQRTLSWIVAMQEELNQFIANDVWELVPQPKNMTIIGTKWVFRNKLDKNSVVSRNKARLVAQGYNQQEGINYDETYALVARIKSIRILLSYAYSLDFKLFQMDVQSAFLNGFINEEVYVAQASGFIVFENPVHVYKLKKALYDMCDEFAKIMHDEFEMSMMGELNFFLGLQIKQMEDDIFFNPSKYIKEILKKFGLEDSKPMKTPMSFDTKLIKDEECESVDSTKYRGMIDSAQILRIPCEGACVFIDRRSVDELVYGALLEGQYQTNLPSPDDIISYIREDQEGQVTRIRHQEEVERENLEGIMARQEIVIPLPPPPSINHLHLISMMMMLMEIMKGPHVHLNHQPLQSHPSLDITLSLSPITPLDHIYNTPSPPSPPQP
nr:retrovirus-related Pol polyprotein from transposon TNT 1-94 [Tanacetum cinerariifolium]